MSQTVSELLVGRARADRPSNMFLIDWRFPQSAWRIAVRQRKIEWVGVRHEEGAALAARRPGQAHRSTRGMRRHHWPRQHASRRRALRSEPRPRASIGAVRRHAAANARHRFYPDHGGRICLFRDVSLYTEPSHRRRRRRPLSIRPLPRLMQVRASRI